MLIELTGVPGTALPVQAMRDHLRLGTGFADDSLQDGLIESYLRAAIAAIEGRIGKMLIQRTFGWTVTEWRDGDGQALPVAPVQMVLSLTLLDRNGTATVVDPARYRLQRDMHRPRLVPAGATLPAIPSGGTAEIAFEAGFGTAWAAVPGDLAQAVMLLAAHYYEHRDEATATRAAMPFGVTALIERWRTVRILGGGAA